MAREISPEELKRRLERGPSAPVLLDVREPWEVERACLPGARCIPSGQIAHRLDELDANAETVVLCHHGVRSRAVCRFLDSRAFSGTFNLTGGIDAWARRIDPSMPTY